MTAPELKHRVERRHAAAKRGAIDGVVVDQRRRMQELDARRRRDQGVLVGIVGVGSAGEQEHDRAQALAAGADDVADERRCHRIVDLRDVGNAIVDPLQIGAHHVEQVGVLQVGTPGSGGQRHEVSFVKFST